MMNTQKPQYDVLMQKVIAELPKTYSSGNPAKLLLHSCCAPCSSSVIKKLALNFKITVFYYNPNIDTLTEYLIRAEEQKKLLSAYNNQKVSPYLIDYLEMPYTNKEFEFIAKGLEHSPEGGARCFECYKLRLKKTAEKANEGGYNFFCSTLSVSPLKNAQTINSIGESLSARGCLWLKSDFKKRNGYLESVRISKELGLYRQDYCGCKYSKISRALSISTARHHTANAG